MELLHAGSAVDAMLKELGYTKGSVYERIDQAVKDRRLTEAMGPWKRLMSTSFWRNLSNGVWLHFARRH